MAKYLFVLGSICLFLISVSFAHSQVQNARNFSSNYQKLRKSILRPSVQEVRNGKDTWTGLQWPSLRPYQEKSVTSTIATATTTRRSTIATTRRPTTTTLRSLPYSDSSNWKFIPKKFATTTTKFTTKKPKPTTPSTTTTIATRYANEYPKKLKKIKYKKPSKTPQIHAYAQKQNNYIPAPAPTQIYTRQYFVRKPPTIPPKDEDEGFFIRKPPPTPLSTLATADEKSEEEEKEEDKNKSKNKTKKKDSKKSGNKNQAANSTFLNPYTAVTLAPGVDPAHPLVQQLIATYGDGGLKKRVGRRRTPKRLKHGGFGFEGLENFLIYIGLVLTWTFWIVVIISYYSLGLKKIGKPVPVAGIPIAIHPHPHRALEMANDNDNDWTNILTMIKLGQEVYEGLDFNSIHCIKKALCELEQAKSHENDCNSIYEQCKFSMKNTLAKYYQFGEN